MHQAPAFPQLDMAIPDGQTVLALDELVAAWGPRQSLSWSAAGPARIAICGPNGCGKSTLLRTIAGEIAPVSGWVRIVPGVLLDQQLDILVPEASLLEQLTRVAAGVGEGRLRQMLAIAGLGAERVLRPSATLSGGERMRGALLLAVLGRPAPRDRTGRGWGLAGPGSCGCGCLSILNMSRTRKWMPWLSAISSEAVPRPADILFHLQHELGIAAVGLHVQVQGVAKLDTLAM
jgi:hypothetical protein